MKKLVYLLALVSFPFLSSCSKDDEVENGMEEIIKENDMRRGDISVDRLESIPQLKRKDKVIGDEIYLKFSDGVMYAQVVSKNSVLHYTYDYTLNGEDMIVKSKKDREDFECKITESYTAMDKIVIITIDKEKFPKSYRLFNATFIWEKYNINFSNVK